MMACNDYRSPSFNFTSPKKDSPLYEEALRFWKKRGIIEIEIDSARYFISRLSRIEREKRRSNRKLLNQVFEKHSHSLHRQEWERKILEHAEVVHGIARQKRRL